MVEEFPTVEGRAPEDRSFLNPLAIVFILVLLGALTTTNSSTPSSTQP